MEYSTMLSIVKSVDERYGDTLMAVMGIKNDYNIVSDIKLVEDCIEFTQTGDVQKRGLKLLSSAKRALERKKFLNTSDAYYSSYCASLDSEINKVPYENNGVLDREVALSKASEAFMKYVGVDFLYDLVHGKTCYYHVYEKKLKELN